MEEAAGTEVPLHVEVSGEGPALVLGHGFGGSARNFRPQQRALAPSWRCALFDARGHARSGAPDAAEAYRIESLVADLGRVVERLGSGPVFVGGLSLGAAVALHFALAHPERVRGLVLASFPAADGRQRALDFADSVDRDGLEAAGARFVWGPESGLDAQGAALVRRGFLEHPGHAVAHMLRGVIARLPSAEELAPRLTTLARPALLVAGGADAGSLAACRALHAALPDARLEVIEAAGHVVNLERPREFNALLLDFLRAQAQVPESSRRRRNG